MSANWSIVYFENSITDEAFFKAAQESFRLALEGKLYGLKYNDNQELVPFKLGRAIVEQFNGDSKRARLIQDGLMSELYGHGILHYPQRNNLHVIADSIVRLNVYLSGRIRRKDLRVELEEKPDPSSEVLFHMMNFIGHLTQTINCQAAHIMFERNPAGRGTGVHLYDSGVLVDDYYYENIEAVGSELIEIIQKPDQVKGLLSGRFEFLTQFPIVRHDLVDSHPYVRYFDGEDLSPNRDYVRSDPNQTDLYVPFWEEDSLPIGAIYCLERPLPDDFLKRYKK